MLELTQKEFETLTTYIQTRYGIDLSKKKVLIEGRLSNMLHNRGINSFEEYMKILFGDTTDNEVTSLLNKLTTNYTFFMREVEHFDFLMSVALPYLEKNRTNHDLRIWSAACSTGEEPYTMAMVLDSYFGERKSLWDTKILATDISHAALDKAKRGIYSKESISNLPQSWQQQYFVPLEDGTFQICQKIRNEVIFAPFNLMDPFPFRKSFDLIFCRNVMIYFDSKTKDTLIDKFYQYTASGGFLCIGHSETVNKQTSQYTYLKPSIYRKGGDFK